MISRRSAAAWVAAAAVVLRPGPAGAQVTTLEAGKTACTNAITRRLGSLHTVRANLDSAGHIPAADRASLDGQIDTAVSGLSQLQATIGADATLPKLRADCLTIVTGYRVYALLIPRVQIVVAAGKVESAADSLRNLGTRLQGRVTADLNRGRDVTSVQGYVTDLGVKVQVASGASAGVVAAMLPLDAKGYPTNRATIVAARTALKTADGALSGALKDASTARDALKVPGM